MNSAEVGEVWQDNLLWPSSNKKSSPINSSNFHKGLQPASVTPEQLSRARLQWSHPGKTPAIRLLELNFMNVLCTTSPVKELYWCSSSTLTVFLERDWLHLPPCQELLSRKWSRGTQRLIHLPSSSLPLPNCNLDWKSSSFPFEVSN